MQIYEKHDTTQIQFDSTNSTINIGFKFVFFA